MVTVIKDLREKIFGCGVEDGQIRTNKCGRVIMVITDQRMKDNRITKTIRALILKEQVDCNGGHGIPFQTIPKEYTEKEIERDFPIVLKGELTFK